MAEFSATEANDETVALDLHHLTATYKTPVGDLAAQARDATQLLVAGLFALPAERSSAGPIASLPVATTALPREKPAPVDRSETKWEAFAKAKGITKKKKGRLEWDETRGKWAPAWGYDKAGGEDADVPIIEVAGPDAPDPREASRVAKKERVDKNKRQRDANDARAKKAKRSGDDGGVSSRVPLDVEDPRRKRGKDAVGGALKRAQTATASLGRFDATVDGEGARPAPDARAKGRKRRFLPATAGDDRGRAMKALEEIRRPTASKPKKGEKEVMDTHDGELPNQGGFKRKKGLAARGKDKKSWTKKKKTT
mmetsp:Transcript_12648/g.39077  ORF Transcript_12648/g.39077 Transcript_12648/m.39077 type:complete len:311 (-) Transcript_12648:42-974(-)